MEDNYSVAASGSGRQQNTVSDTLSELLNNEKEVYPDYMATLAR